MSFSLNKPCYDSVNTAHNFMSKERKFKCEPKQKY